MVIQKRFDKYVVSASKYVVSASKGTGAVPGGQPFEVNGSPPEPVDSDGQPEFLEEEETVELNGWTEDGKKIYKDLLLEIKKLRDLIKLKVKEEKEKQEKEEED